MMDFFTSILTNGQLFIGIVAFLGLLIQRKSASDCISGGFKAFIGMTIMVTGNGIVMNAFQALSDAFTMLFKIDNPTPIGSHVDFIAESGSNIGLIMLLTLVANLLIAKFTPLKAIALNGDNYFWFPLVFLGVGAAAGLQGQALFWFALIFNILFSVIWPYLMIKPCENLIGDRSFTICHTAGIFCLLGDFIGRFIGNKEKSTEDIKVSDKFAFIKDTTITSALVITIVYIVVGLLIGPEGRATAFGEDQQFIVFSLVQGATFATGLVVLLTGARMVISEIVPAFNGIAQKFIPNAIPGLDIPMVFPYAPTAVVIGFVVSLVTSMITLFALGYFHLMKLPLVPLTLACYFDVAPGAIFANKRGGRVAAIVTSALGGILLMVLVNITLPMVASTVGDFIQAYGGNGYSFWILVSHFFAKLFA